MKRGIRFTVVLATSALTFATLMATVGPKEFNKQFQHRPHEHQCMHHCKESCDENEAQKIIPSSTNKTDNM